MMGISKISTTLCALMLVGTASWGQSADSEPQWSFKLSSVFWESLLKADIPQISSFFSASIEISLPSGSGLYSKKQAEVILSNFIKSNSISDAAIDHEKQMGNSILTIGSISIDNSQYRIYILSIPDNQGEVQQLRIEEETN